MAVDLHVRAALARSVRDAEAALEDGGDPAQKTLSAEAGRKALIAAFDLLQKARSQVTLRAPRSFR